MTAGMPSPPWRFCIRAVPGAMTNCTSITELTGTTFHSLREKWLGKLRPAENGSVQRMRSSQESEIWINGGYFIFRNKVFDYIRDGEELVLEPFNRLIEADQLLAFKYEGFWRAMDTLRDKQVLEDMVEKGNMPWRAQFMDNASS